MSDLRSHANTKFQRWYTKQSAQGKDDFAAYIEKHPGTVKSNWVIPTGKPLESHFTEMKPTASRPSPLIMLAMSEATGGCCSYKDMLRHFYPDIKREFLKPHITKRC